MQSLPIFLEQIYRRIVRSISIWTGIFNVVTILISILFFLLTQNAFAGIVAVIALISGIGCLLSLWMLTRNYPFWQTLIPFSLSVILCEIAIAVWLPELRLAVAPFLAVVILLASLTGQRKVAVVATIICIVVIILIIVVGSDNTVSPISTHLLRFLQASSLMALFVAVWAFLDQIMSAQMRALQLANQRTQEAESARQAADAARHEVEQRAAEQQRLLDLVAVLELPILQIDDQVLLAPLVGNLDSRRAEQLRNRVLETVAAKRAHTVIIDITGITLIDTAVAKALIDTAVAIRLLGARTIISGIRPAVAQTLVHLNADLGDITTAPNPEAALSLARRPVAA